MRQPKVPPAFINMALLITSFLFQVIFLLFSQRVEMFFHINGDVAELVYDIALFWRCCRRFKRDFFDGKDKFKGGNFFNKLFNGRPALSFFNQQKRLRQQRGGLFRRRYQKIIYGIGRRPAEKAMGYAFRLLRVKNHQIRQLSEVQS